MIPVRNILFVFSLALWLISCSSEIATSGSTAKRFAQAPDDRPGLGTKWGETRQSPVTLSDFHRADPEHAVGTAAIYYNDEAGIRAMANAAYWEHGWPVLPGTEPFISVGLKTPVGFFYPGMMIGGRWLVAGKEGRRYSIAIQNKTDLRLEIVLSVDGLDVLDGAKSSLRKRGYLLAPHSRLTVDGFRQSTNAVAAFRFSPVRESYTAEKYARTQNVGVIGIAFFNERGTNAPTVGETRRRLNAKPFPGNFSAPP